ncbi:hypothetical protein GLE_4622 [Lysobacter enzymogenes]|uniref:Uncharacterized protein n=1 Tax=Lysobacter enzymogenes TaxID=69 RepID=A0A0S2DMH9_LYSEN|nr:hypothetical protein GLE_4622 [Lysobacter enzymogenes]
MSGQEPAARAAVGIDAPRAASAHRQGARPGSRAHCLKRLKRGLQPAGAEPALLRWAAPQPRRR